MASEVQSRCERARLFCIRNFLPLGFLVALVWALVWPLPGEAISKPEVEGYRVVSTINVVVIFLISGLTLKTDDIKKAVGKEGRRGYIYGVVSILGITGCMGFLAAEIPFDVEEFTHGLAVFSVVPTTISSGTTLVANVRTVVLGHFLLASEYYWIWNNIGSGAFRGSYNCGAQLHSVYFMGNIYKIG